MGSAASCSMSCGVIPGTGGWSRDAFASPLAGVSLMTALGLSPCSRACPTGTPFHGELAPARTAPQGSPRGRAGAPGSPAGRAGAEQGRETRTPGALRGQGGDLRGRNIRERPLLPGSVCLNPRCGRASMAERSKGRLLREQIAPAKAISRDVRPGLPIAHPWNCCWARLRGVLGSSPNGQSGAGKRLLSRELCPCHGKQLSLVSLPNLPRSGAAAR